MAVVTAATKIPWRDIIKYAPAAIKALKGQCPNLNLGWSAEHGWESILRSDKTGKLWLNPIKNRINFGVAVFEVTPMPNGMMVRNGIPQLF
jgi:hypothetical protein